ncbi:hypothetical protein BX666DRAFT_1315847 [Dichotomocladium elegans]|nr:hypothetical protein BX666DRAFT_1315847 [Dichotomocladium elegans]
MFQSAYSKSFYLLIRQLYTILCVAITNYIDPIVSPIFHQPMCGRLFRWLNREMENTEMLRPDGAMFLTEQPSIEYAIGFCQVKSNENEGNTGTHEDLYRLAIFCKNPSDKNQINAYMALQVVGNVDRLNHLISLFYLIYGIYFVK